MKLTLRKAAFSDAEFLLQLRNQKENRMASFSSEKVSLETHLNWLGKVLNNPNEFLFVALLDGAPVGQFRVNQDRKVSVGLDNKVHGRGLGTQLIRLGSEEFLKTHNEKLFAEIKPDNIASIKAFKNAGYQNYSEASEKIVLIK